MDRHEALKATLTRLSAPKKAEEVTMSKTQKDALVKEQIIGMQEKQFNLQQSIEALELQKRNMEHKIKEDTEALKSVGGEIDKMRSSGKAAWEVVGIQTVTYIDPFHTGLSKRTPTGGFFTS